MKRCITCGVPLWAVFLLFGFPWTKREKSFKDANDCIDLLPKKVTEKIREEKEIEDI